MRRPLSHRILAIVLVLTRLLLGDFTHPVTAQATVRAPTQPMTMMGWEPCSGMAGTPADHAGYPVPANDGTCCKSSQCPCLHAPALMVALPMPMMFSISYPEVSATEVHRISGPPSVFFRPPIQILP